MVEALRTLEHDYRAVVEAKAPRWGVCALRRIGGLYLHLGDALLNAPPPRTLTAEQQDMYLDAVADQVAPIKAKGHEALELAVAKGKQQGIDNPCVREARKLLEQR